VPEERARRLLLPEPQLLPLVQLLWAEWLREEVLLPVAHRHMGLTIPRLLRPLFRRRRELLGELARAGAEAVKELVRHASGEGDARPGMVVCVATAGDLLQWHPHLHLITTDGGRSADGSWHTPAQWDAEWLMRLFRERLFGSLLDKRAISRELVQKLLAWRHPGFSAHVGEPITAEDKQRLEAPPPTSSKIPSRSNQRMSILAFVSDRHSINRILDHLGLRSPQQGRPPLPARGILRVAEHGEGWGGRHTGTEAIPCCHSPLRAVGRLCLQTRRLYARAPRMRDTRLGHLRRTTSRCLNTPPTWAAEPISKRRAHKPPIKTSMDRWWLQTSMSVAPLNTWCPVSRK
jgi:hypothetical protein